jgi:hypothetical protein
MARDLVAARSHFRPGDGVGTWRLPHPISGPLNGQGPSNGQVPFPAWERARDLAATRSQFRLSEGPRIWRLLGLGFGPVKGQGSNAR